jgi:hypothetical protein
MKNYNTLKQMYNTFGHCSMSGMTCDKTLARWIGKQKKKYKNFKDGVKPALTEEQVTLLHEINFFGSNHVACPQSKRSKMPQFIKARGRPKSTTLIPSEAQALLNRANNDTDDKGFSNADSYQSSGELPKYPPHFSSQEDNRFCQETDQHENAGRFISGKEGDLREDEIEDNHAIFHDHYANSCDVSDKTDTNDSVDGEQQTGLESNSNQL